MTTRRKLAVACGAIAAALAAYEAGKTVDCSQAAKDERAAEYAAEFIACPDSRCLTDVEAQFTKTVEICR